MATKKLVTVFGATGAQGGSVVGELLSDRKAVEQFRLRGITRDSSKPAAKELTSRGVEVVSADLDDKISLKNAIKGSYAVFAVTNYWESLDGERESKQGFNIVDVSKEAGVEHLIFSTLYNVTEISKGEFKNVLHFDSKARISKYMQEKCVPHTNFMPGFYMTNLISNIVPASNGQFMYLSPYSDNTPIPLFATDEDTGLFVKSILLNREKTLGKNVYAATDYYTPKRIAREFKQVTGKDVNFVQIPEEKFKGALAEKGMPDFVQVELYENMMFMEPYGYYAKDSLDFSLGLLDRPPTTFVDFAKLVDTWH